MYKNFKELVKKYGVTKLLGSDGSCACGELYLFGIKIKTHCHKTTNTGTIGGCSCLYAGVHVTPDPGIKVSVHELREIGNLFANYMNKSYSYNTNVVVVP